MATKTGIRKKNPDQEVQSKKRTGSRIASRSTNTVPLRDLFQCRNLINKRSTFKVLHVREGRKNTTKVFSAVVADDTAVIRLVTFGLINCQKAKSVIHENGVVGAKWNKATYDPQEPHYRT